MSSSSAARPNKVPSAPASTRHAITNPDSTTTGTWQPETSLYSDGAFPGTEQPVLAPVSSTHQRIPGTPYLDTGTGDVPGALRPTQAQIEQTRRKVAGAAIPDGAGRYPEMAATALLDNYALMLPNGAVQGAGSPYWAFVWPRDNSLVVVSYAMLGLHEDAWAALRFIYSVQESDGQWEARYLPDGSGEVPDERGRQDDGIGYTLWATWVAARLSPAGLAEQELAALEPAILRAVRAAGQVLEPDTSLPRTSQDFWEMDQPEPSLGVAGPLHFGLRAGAQLARELGDPALAAQAQQHADALLRAIELTYAATGFPRFPSGGGRDASVAFLLPPFLPQEGSPTGARKAWEQTLTTMRVPNGGLRPGEEWPDGETAWNTQTSLYAIVAAALGERAVAEELLDWMAARRTRMGCLPEKVTSRGQPAAVAPICTVASSVLIALGLLDGHQLPAPGRLEGE